MNFTPPPAPPQAPPTAPARSQGAAAYVVNANSFAAWLVSLGNWLISFVPYLGTFIAELGIFKNAINAAVTGGAFAIDYTFSTATAAGDPGPGVLRLNAAQQNTATAAFMDVLSADGSDYAAALDLMDDSSSTVKGFFTIRHANDGKKFLIFALTALAAPGGYRQPTLVPQASSSANPFADGDPITVTFSRTGDQGIQGIQGPPGSLNGGNLTGGLNELRTQVPGHATAMPIWDLANGNVIEATGGVIAFTDFPDAPQAGARRTVYPVAGSTFPHSGPFSVEGAATYTVQAGDRVEVEAVTVSTFRLWIEKADGSAVVATPAPGIFQAREAQSSGNASAFGVGSDAWGTRVLNSTSLNTIAGASLASNQITLPAGTYEVEAFAPAGALSSAQLSHSRLRLWNVTDGVLLVSGPQMTSHAASSSGYTLATPTLNGRFTLAASKTLRLDQFHKGTSGTGGNGGVAIANGDPEIYAQITFRKVG